MNQCDGCRRGLPLFPTLSGGEIHKGDGRWDLIGCTKHLYENLKPPPEVKKTIPYWPYCETCEKPFDFDEDEPFAYCKCGCTEWGYPRPAPYVQKPNFEGW